MFQFTTETIINRETGKLKGKSFLFEDYTFKVDRVANFKKSNAFSIVAYKRKGRSATNEVAELDLSTYDVQSGDQCRLEIYVKQEGLTTSEYANHYVIREKPFMYEFISKGTATDDIDAMIKSWNNEATLQGFKHLELTKSGTTLTVSATDQYQRFVEIKLVKFVTPEPPTGASLTGYRDYEVIALGSIKTPGDEGQGTTAQLIKNHRLPTLENWDFYGINSDERPEPASIYDQFTIVLTTKRHNIGHDVMGSVGTSETTHVFYVKQDISNKFEAELSKLTAVVNADDSEPDVTLADVSIATAASGASLSVSTPSSGYESATYKRYPKLDETEAGDSTKVTISGGSITIPAGSGFVAGDKVGVLVTNNKISYPVTVTLQA